MKSEGDTETIKDLEKEILADLDELEGCCELADGEVRGCSTAIPIKNVNLDEDELVLAVKS